jgi:hypothetical protein
MLQRIPSFTAPNIELEPLEPAAPLAQREVVGERLAGVQQVGEAVDHRHRAVPREVEDVLVREDARHDPVHVARQHARRVGDRLAAVQLDVVAAQEQRAPAQLVHPDLERHAGARGRLLEDHRQRLAGEGRGVRVRRRLDRGRLLEQQLDLVARPVLEREEVFLGHGVVAA